MKRLLAIALFVTFSVAVHAQWNVSADVSFSSTSYSYNRQGLDAFNSNLPSGMEAQFNPHIGYAFNGVFEMGVELGIGNLKYSYADGCYDPLVDAWKQMSADDKTMLTFSASLYASFCCVNFGRLTLRAEVAGGYGYGFGKLVHTEFHASDGWEIATAADVQRHLLFAQVVPVFNYAFNNHFSMDVYLNIFSASVNRFVDKQWAPRNTSDIGESMLESVTATTDFGVGMNALNTNLLSLGFRYSF